MAQLLRLLSSAMCLLIVIVAVSGSTAWTHLATGIRIVKADWVGEFGENGGWAALPAGDTSSARWTRKAELELAAGLYDIHWRQVGNQKIVVLARNVKVEDGAMTIFRADTGLRRITAPEFAKFGENGGWAATPAGESFNNAVQYCIAEEMLLPAGEYDIYWRQVGNQKIVLLARHVKVEASAITNVRAVSGIRRITAPEFQTFGENGGWAATPAGESIDKAVQNCAAEAMLLPAGEYDIYWRQVGNQKTVLLARDVKVETGAITNVRAQSGIRRIAAPEFATFGDRGGWVATPSGKPITSAVQDSNAEAMLLPAGEYDIYWVQAATVVPVRIGQRVVVDENKLTDVHANTGIKLKFGRLMPEIDPDNWWGVVAPGGGITQPTHFAKRKLSPLLLPPGTYDVVWRADAKGPKLISSNVTVEAGQIAEVVVAAAPAVTGVVDPPVTQSSGIVSFSQWVVPIVMLVLIALMTVILVRRSRRHSSTGTGSP